MSECIGEGCTHPDHQERGWTTEDRPSWRQVLEAQVALEKLAAMNRAERRAWARKLRRA